MSFYGNARTTLRIIPSSWKSSCIHGAIPNASTKFIRLGLSQRRWKGYIPKNLRVRSVRHPKDRASKQAKEARDFRPRVIRNGRGLSIKKHDVQAGPEEIEASLLRDFARSRAQNEHEQRMDLWYKNSETSLPHLRKVSLEREHTRSRAGDPKNDAPKIRKHRTVDSAGPKNHQYEVQVPIRKHGHRQALGAWEQPAPRTHVTKAEDPDLARKQKECSGPRLTFRERKKIQRVGVTVTKTEDGLRFQKLKDPDTFRKARSTHSLKARDEAMLLHMSKFPKTLEPSDVSEQKKEKQNLQPNEESTLLEKEKRRRSPIRRHFAHGPPDIHLYRSVDRSSEMDNNAIAQPRNVTSTLVVFKTSEEESVGPRVPPTTPTAFARAKRRRVNLRFVTPHLFRPDKAVASPRWHRKMMKSAKPSDRFLRKDYGDILALLKIHTPLQGTGNSIPEGDPERAEQHQLEDMLDDITYAAPSLSMASSISARWWAAGKSDQPSPKRPTRWTQQKLLQYLRQLIPRKSGDALKHSAEHKLGSAVVEEIISVLTDRATLGSLTSQALNPGLSALVRMKNYAGVMRVYNHLHSHGFKMDNSNYEIFLFAAAWSSGSVRYKHLLKDMVDSGLHPTRKTWFTFYQLINQRYRQKRSEVMFAMEDLGLLEDDLSVRKSLKKTSASKTSASKEVPPTREVEGYVPFR